jgi:hypothetical protein
MLEVMTAKGAKRFVDKPLHEDIGGLRWRYCGYNAQAKAHLIEKIDESLYSGALLFDKTRKPVHAGISSCFPQAKRNSWRSNRKMAWMVRTGPSTMPLERLDGRATPRLCCIHVRSSSMEQPRRAYGELCLRICQGPRGGNANPVAVQRFELARSHEMLVTWHVAPPFERTWIG